MNSLYNIGRDATLVFLWNGAQVTLRDITMFQANPDYNTQRVDPLNSKPVEFNTPNGWRGSFQLARADGTVDTLVNDIERQFWANGTIQLGKLYAYIRETDATTTVWQFDNVSFTKNQDPWQGEGVVHETVSFFASQRTKL